MAWGTEKYIVILTKTFPIKNSTWGTEKCVAVFAKAFSIDLFYPFIKTHLTITKIWWLMTIILKVTVCIFDSFVCDSSILDHHKILWFCSILIWAFLALVRICKGVTCLWGLFQKKTLGGGGGEEGTFFYPTTHGIQFPPTPTTHGIQFPPTPTTHVIRKFRTPTTHRIQFS